MKIVPLVTCLLMTSSALAQTPPPPYDFGGIVACWNNCEIKFQLQWENCGYTSPDGPGRTICFHGAINDRKTCRNDCVIWDLTAPWVLFRVPDSNQEWPDVATDLAYADTIHDALFATYFFRDACVSCDTNSTCLASSVYDWESTLSTEGLTYTLDSTLSVAINTDVDKTDIYLDTTQINFAHFLRLEYWFMLEGWDWESLYYAWCDQLPLAFSI